MSEQKSCSCRCWAGAQRGGDGSARPPPAFHTVAKEMSKNRGATHLTLRLRPCISSSFLS